MRYNRDNRVVLTLNAGGTNLVFSAIQGEKEIVKPMSLPSHGDNLELILRSIVDGFSKVKAKLSNKAAAISFCFPGPARTGCKHGRPMLARNFSSQHESFFLLSFRRDFEPVWILLQALGLTNP